MKMLVTGAAGFIGSHLVKELLEEGHDVYGVDNLSGGLDSMQNVDERIIDTFSVVDLRDPKLAEEAIAKIQPEVVYHAAAWAHEGLSQFSPRLITENNTNIFLNTLIPAVKNGMKKFVFFSSMAAYGDQAPPFVETMELKPVDIYGINKAACEGMLKVLSGVHGFDYTVIRPHNVYGEFQSLSDPYRNVIGIWMNRLLDDKGYYIYGDGQSKRAFSYVGDMVPAMVKIATDPKTNGEAYNLGADKEYSLNELSDALLEVTGMEVEIEHLPDRPAEVKEAYSSHDKAKKDLGFEDKTPLKVGLEKMWDWAQTIGHKEPRRLSSVELYHQSLPPNWK